ncbi:matrixin family metalloprotease, partial [Candidatus Poribacteria bacterium]|nr:matrixin family metalloprotease [Candidatus Poribacteria bacterium]
MHAYRISFLSLMWMLICYLHPAFGFEYQRSRWRLAELPIPCHLNTASVPKELVVDDVEQAVIQSLEAWNRAAGIRIFEYAGRIQSKAVLADDGWNAISFVSTDWLKVTDGLPADRLTAGTTCTWSVNDPIGRPPRHGFTKSDFLRAFDIALNAETYRWTIGARPEQYDIQSAITHELGHVLSLGHSDDDPRAPDAPTMVERMFPNDTKLRTLEPDDIAGVQSIYRKVSGVLREEAQWENMIWIDGDFTVPRGVSLKIAPSTPQTIVHFSPGAKLIIEGGLTVDSSTLERILLTGIDGAQWGGLEIHANDRACQIAGSIFEGTAVALTLTSAADVSVKDCEFRGNPIGIQGVSGRNISITGCTFDNAKTAMTLMSTINGTVENCEFIGNPLGVQVIDGQNFSIGGVFRENGVGVEIRLSREVKITKSTLEQNDVGVRLIDTDAHIRASNFTENTIGIEIHSDQPTFLRENSITHNEIGIRVVRGAVDLGRSPDDLGRNNLFSNAVWNLKLEVPPPTPILAQGNYWGEL